MSELNLGGVIEWLRRLDGDWRLSRYEVTQFLSNRGQPLDDQEVVANATVDDLDPRLVEQVLRRAAERSPRAFDGVENRSMVVPTRPRRSSKQSYRIVGD